MREQGMYEQTMREQRTHEQTMREQGHERSSLVWAMYEWSSQKLSTGHPQLQYS